jgi:hypothetical protein
VININGTNYTLPEFNLTVYGIDGTYYQSGYTTDDWTPLITELYPVVPVQGSGAVTVDLNPLPNGAFTWTFYPYSLTPSYWIQCGENNRRLIFHPVHGSGEYCFLVTMQGAGCTAATMVEFGQTDGSISYSQYSYSYSQQSSILSIDFGTQQTVNTAVLTKKTVTKSYTVRVFDFNGSSVMQGNSAGEPISFNLSGKPNGIYIVNIYDLSSNSPVKTMKFLKEY